MAPLIGELKIDWCRVIDVIKGHRKHFFQENCEVNLIQ